MIDLLFSLSRALLLAASFIGLCAAIRVRLQINRFISPFISCCSIIVVLMFGGMLNVLNYTVWALYSLGFIGLLYAYILKRSRPEWPLILALVPIVAFLIWRFYFCPLYRNDDVSHWGLVARHLLRFDRFPNGSDAYVYFQSYPLGTACFIYYIGRITANTEGVYLLAQNFLLCALYLPMFSLVRNRKRVFYPILAALFCLFFHYFRYMINLQVDLVLSFFGIGTAASIAFYRNDKRRIAIAALPAMIAVAFIKNSGLFFSATSATLLWLMAKRGGTKRASLRAWACLAISIGAYLLWELHVKMRFPAGLDTKHAVSLSAYSQQVSSKGLAVITTIAMLQLRALFRMSMEQIIAIAFMVPASAIILFCASKLAAPRRKRILKAYLGIIATYLVWYILIFLMYVFSMPESESLQLASFYRYTGTGLCYMLGLTAILLLHVLQEAEVLLKPLKWIARLSPLFIAAVIAITAWPAGGRINKMFERSTRLSSTRVVLADAEERCGLTDGCRLLVFLHFDGNGEDGRHYFTYYNIKYTFATDDILMIAADDTNPGRYYINDQRAWIPLDANDVLVQIADTIDDCDAFLLLDEFSDQEEEFARYLDSYEGDTIIYRSHG